LCCELKVTVLQSVQGCEDPREARCLLIQRGLTWGRIMEVLCHNCSRLFLEGISGLDPSKGQKLTSVAWHVGSGSGMVVHGLYS
jgi:hypothetical protein